MAGEVIDLRGSPTGLEGLGEGLAALIGALKKDPNDELRAALLENPALANQVAMAARRRSRDIQSGELPVDPRVGDAGVPTEELDLPPATGFGLFPPEIINELLIAFPATRAEEVETAKGELLTPEAEAKLEVGELEARGAQAALIKTETERDKAVIEAATAAGMTPEAIANLQVVQFNIQAAGAELDLEGIKEFGRIYDGASPEDKAIITAGLVGSRGQAFAQALLQRERFNQEESAARLRATLTGAKDPEEMAEARFLFKNDVRGERDRIVDRINAIADDKDRRDELPGLIEDMRDLAITMMRVDPSVAVQTANEIRGIIRRHKIVGAEFSISDITETKADEVEVWARVLADEGMSADAMQHMNTDLASQSPDGRANPRLMLAITERANQIIEGKQTDEEMAALAAEGARNLMANPDLLTENARKIATLEEELDSLIALKDSPDVQLNTPKRIVELTWIIRLHKLMSFFAGSGRPRVDIPRTPEEARRFQIPRGNQ